MIVHIVFSSESSGGTVILSVKLSRLLVFDCAGIERLSSILPLDRPAITKT